MVVYRMYQILVMSDVEDSNIDLMFPSEDHQDSVGEVAGGESTLDSPRQPSNQPTGPTVAYPKTYVSIRVTVTHDQWDVVESHLSDASWYISYPHTGSNGNNPHFHVFVPGSGKSDVEKYRKRLKSAGFSGNKQLSAKFCENGLEHAIQYGSKEGTNPKFKGDSVGDWILHAPRWLKANLKDNLNPFKPKGKRDDVMEGMLPLTGKNALILCWKYRQRMNISSMDIGDVILHMLDSGRYYIDPSWARSPLPTFYKDVFYDSCKKNRLTWSGTKKCWMNCLFRDRNF